MQTRKAARVAAEADPQAAATASTHAVLFSEDLFLQPLWPSLDRDSKRALRVVCTTMRSLVDDAVVRDLTLLGVVSASMLKPLATAALYGLTSLTLREGFGNVHDAWRWERLPKLSVALGATLRVLDISNCFNLSSITAAVQSCTQLRSLRMPSCYGVSGLSSLRACSQTLEELWIADNQQILSLAPLKACTSLRKLDLHGCGGKLYDQVEGLRETCTQLADPSSVKLEGLAQRLQPNLKHDPESLIAGILRICDPEELLEDSDEEEDDQELATAVAVAAAGVFPAMVELLGSSDAPAFVQARASWALSRLAAVHPQNMPAIAAAGAMPALLQLLERRPSRAAFTLRDLAAVDTEIRSVIAAAGAISSLLKLLGPDCSDYVQEAAAAADGLGAAAGALWFLSDSAENQAAITAAGAIPALVELLGADLWDDVQEKAARALCNLACDHALNQATIVAAGAVQPLVQLLKSDKSSEVLQEAAADALCALAVDDAQTQSVIVAAVCHLG
ncbi:hypothetical protein FOA52_009388 [Chlamydomonas sp. UWO 241]|nr:hypothetical protein FOA52_009388 [Chlamydomonas sp. UWO 241]